MLQIKEFHGDIEEEYCNLQNYFPPFEIFPFDVIANAYKNSNYIIFHLYKKDQLVGFAHLVKTENTIILSYLAIKLEFQNQGLGSYFVRELKKWFSNYDSMLIEVEKEDFKNPVTSSRIKFYQKLGFSRVENIEYEIKDLNGNFVEINLYVSKLNNPNKKYSFHEIKAILLNYYQVLIGKNNAKEFHLEKKESL